MRVNNNQKLEFILFNQRWLKKRFSYKEHEHIIECVPCCVNAAYDSRFVSGYLPSLKRNIGFSLSAHKFVWILKNNISPGEKDVIHHKCLNSWCVNPNHLECITSKEHKKLHIEVLRNKKSLKADIERPTSKKNTEIEGKRNFD